MKSINKINLSQTSTLPPKDFNLEDIEKETKKMAKKIDKLHEDMVAEGKRSLLIIFQGMDASGKDGSTNAIFRYCAPINLSVTSFKKPTEIEMAHDFLWRVHNQVPQKGQIKVFNRSHYEDILIQRVHNWITPEHVDKRMSAINAFEELLQFDNNTTIIKFFLHISKAEQKIQLQERIDEADKNWKHNDGDWEERKHWDKYMEAYEYAINNSKIPWTIVPVDNRDYKNYLVTKTVLEVMKSWDMKRPTLKK